MKASDGSIKWTFTGKNWFWAQPVIDNATVYAGCLDGFIYALNPDTGVIVKEFDVKKELDLKSPVAFSSQPVIVDSSIIFADREGVIFAINTDNSQIRVIINLKEKLKKDVTVDGPLTAYKGIIYVHTQDGALQRINAVTGASLSPILLHT